LEPPLVSEDDEPLYDDVNTDLAAQTFLDIAKPQTVLVCGCAFGRLVRGFLRIEPTISVYGFDLSEYAISHGFAEVRDKIQMLDASAEQIPFSEKHFDLTVALDFFEHQNNEYLDFVLDNVARVSKKILIRQPLSAISVSPRDRGGFIAAFNPLTHQERVALIDSHPMISTPVPNADDPIHPSEQGRDFWISKFAERGFVEKALPESLYVFSNPACLSSFTTLYFESEGAAPKSAVGHGLRSDVTGLAGDGQPAAYMLDGRYVLATGQKPDGQAEMEIVELPTPVLGDRLKDAAAIQRFVGDAKPYHPIPIDTFEGIEVSRPSVDRYNIAYKALSACGELSGSTMYDLGCHYGYLSFSFECCGLQVSACDRNPDVIAVAFRLARILGSKVDFKLADIRTVVKTHCLWDYVLGMNVFHYVLEELNVKDREQLILDLGQITRVAAVVTTLEWDGFSYGDIAALGGFSRAEMVGEPEDSHSIWLMVK
jgi:SAM-dependent methyltransferase